MKVSTYSWSKSVGINNGVVVVQLFQPIGSWMARWATDGITLCLRRNLIWINHVEVIISHISMLIADRCKLLKMCRNNNKGVRTTECFGQTRSQGKTYSAQRMIDRSLINVQDGTFVGRCTWTDLNEMISGVDWCVRTTYFIENNHWVRCHRIENEGNVIDLRGKCRLAHEKIIVLTNLREDFVDLKSSIIAIRCMWVGRLPLGNELVPPVRNIRSERGFATVQSVEDRLICHSYSVLWPEGRSFLDRVRCRWQSASADRTDQSPDDGLEWSSCSIQTWVERSRELSRPPRTIEPYR